MLFRFNKGPRNYYSKTYQLTLFGRGPVSIYSWQGHTWPHLKFVNFHRRMDFCTSIPHTIWIHATFFVMLKNHFLDHFVLATYLPYTYITIKLVERAEAQIWQRLKIELLDPKKWFKQWFIRHNKERKVVWNKILRDLNLNKSIL